MNVCQIMRNRLRTTEKRRRMKFSCLMMTATTRILLSFNDALIRALLFKTFRRRVEDILEGWATDSLKFQLCL